MRLRHKVTGVLADVPEESVRRLGAQWEPVVAAKAAPAKKAPAKKAAAKPEQK